MNYHKYKYVGLLGLFSLIGLKGFTDHNPIYFIFFINVLWFMYFYENSPIYKHIKSK